MITTQSTVKNTSSKRRGSVQKNLYEPTLYNGLSVLQECHVPNKMHVYAAPPNSDWKQGFVEMFPRWLQNYLPDVNVKVTILCLAWYVTSSISSNLSKSILREFPHPVGLTELQFLTNALLCLFFIIVVNHFHHQDLKSTWVSKNLRNFPEGVLPIYLSGNFQECILQRFLTLDRLALVNTFPMGIFQFFGHVTSYKATSMIPVSLVHSVKSLSPIITLCWYRFVKRKHFYPMTYYTLIPLIAGVILTSSSSGSKKYSSVASDSSATGSWTLVGLLFAAVSMTIFVSQNIFAKSILTVKKRELLPSQKNVPLKASSQSTPYNLDKITILFYCSCIGFVLTLPLFITRELLASASVFGDFTAHVVYLVAIYGLTHFLQAMLAFQLIGMLSPVNYSIANIMKRIVVIGVALIWESRLSSRQILGLSMTILGLYGYDKWGNRPSNSE